MTSNRTQLIARLSILTALTVVLGYYTKLPTPTGIVTLLDLGEGIEPAVFNRLKSLLDAGKREEAWEGCLQYVLDNTAAVRAWIGSDAHPGIEFFLRDHYFNSGSKNTGKILQRVLDKHHSGLTVDGIIGPMSKAFLHNSLSRGNDVAFLDDLREQRAAFYRSCKQFPTFGKGWLRRCDDAFSFARSLA